MQGGPLITGLNYRPSAGQVPGDREGKAAPRLAKMLSPRPALTCTQSSAPPQPPDCSPDPGPLRNPPAPNQQPFGSRTARVPEAPLATSPRPRADGPATVPQRHPRGKRACLAREARTLGNCSLQGWGPGPAGRPPHCTLRRPDSLQPCSQHSLPCRSLASRTSRSVTGLVVASGAQPASSGAVRARLQALHFPEGSAAALGAASPGWVGRAQCIVLRAGGAGDFCDSRLVGGSGWFPAQTVT